VTLWLSADARDAWRPSPSGQPGGQKGFSDLAITAALTLRLVFRVPLRQAEGFLRSVLSLMDVDLEAPDSTTLSRRSRNLDVELDTWCERARLRMNYFSETCADPIGVLPNPKLQSSPKQLQDGARSQRRQRRTVVVNLTVPRREPLGALTAYFGRLDSKDVCMSSTSGTIKRITDRGFGFIAGPDGIEYFFHQSACTSTPFDSLREGDNVTFSLGQGPKGPRAEDVAPA